MPALEWDSEPLRAGNHARRPGGRVRRLADFARAFALAGLIALEFAGMGIAQSLPPANPRPEQKTGAGLVAGMGNGPAVQLSLRDVIELALRKNLDIRVERYDLDVSRIRIRGAHGYYDPLFGFNAATSSQASPTTSLLQGGNIAKEVATARNFAPSLTQNLPTGGSFTATLNNSKNGTNDFYTFVNPLYNSGFDFNLQQPLLRGLLGNPIKHQLRLLNLNAKISQVQFRQSVSEMVERVQDQYWNLVYVNAAYKAREESRDLALSQRNQIQQKVQAGLLTPVALTSAEAEVALRNQEMLQAEVQIVVTENGLKRLIAGEPGDPIWMQRLVPTDQPQVTEPPSTLEDATRLALHNRPELESLDLQLQANRVDRNFYRWQSKPQLNLMADVGSIGFAGPVYTPIFDVNGIPIGRLPYSGAGGGGFGTALSQAYQLTYPNWNFGINLQIPIFNRSAKAQEAEAEVNHRRLQTQVKQEQETIMVEVTNAYQSVVLQRRTLDVARESSKLSQEQVKGETERFAAGFTTNFELLRYQRDLEDARVSELRAEVDYQIALAALQRAMDVIIDANDLEVASKPR